MTTENLHSSIEPSLPVSSPADLFESYSHELPVTMGDCELELFLAVNFFPMSNTKHPYKPFFVIKLVYQAIVSNSNTPIIF